jgi:tetratricopeptide (TPR) repeat protein
MSELLVKIYISQENYTLALSEINHLLRLYFLVPEYLMTKAEIFALMRSKDRAIGQLNILFGLWREFPDKLSILSEKQIAIGDYKGAIQSIQIAIEIDPNVLEYGVQLVRIHLLQNEISKAQNLVTELDKLHAKMPLLSIVKGEVAKQQGQLELAQQYFLEAYELDNAYALAAVKLYQLALQGVQTEQFLTVMNQHLRKYVDAHLVRNLVADYYMLESNYEEAKFHYKILLWVESLPDRENILNNLANIALNAQNLDLALSYAKQAYKLNPRSAAVVNTMAWVLAQQGQYGDSLALMRKAISLRAFDSDFQYNLSYVLAKLDRKPQAIAALEKAMLQDSRVDKRREALELLSTLQGG